MQLPFMPLLAAVFALLTISPAEAQRARAPDASPFDGLLAPGMQMVDAPLDIASLANSKVIVVPSAAFNAYVETWDREFNRGNAHQGMLAWWSGYTEGVVTEQRQATDPRRFSDQVVDVLRQHFREVGAAGDFAEAREQGADYYVIVDFTGVLNNWAMRYRSRGGVYMLNGSLERVLVVENESVVRQRVSSVFDDLTQGAQASQNALTRTYEDGINATIDPIVTRLRERLTAAPH